MPNDRIFIAQCGQMNMKLLKFDRKDTAEVHFFKFEGEVFSVDPVNQPMMLKVFEKLPNAEKITVDEIIEEQQSLPKLIHKGEIGEIKAHFEENPKDVDYVARLGKYQQCSLLYLAVSSNRQEVVEYLLKKRPKTLNTKNGKERETALHRAVRSLQLATVTSLLASGASMVTKDKHGLKPVDIAMRMYKESKSAEVKKTAEKIVKALKGNRFNRTARPFNPAAAAWEEAAMKGAVDKMIADLRKEVRIEKELGESRNDDSFENPGMAIVKNNPLMLDRYLETGDPNFVNDRGFSLLEIAMQCSRTSERNYYTELLLEKGANPNLTFRFGLTPLHRAVQEQSLFLVRILLNHGADPTREDKQGRIPIAMVDKIPKRIKNNETIASLEMILCAAQQKKNLENMHHSLENIQIKEPEANPDDLSLTNLNLKLP